MTINFEHLELLKEMFDDIKTIKKLFENRIEKRWLSTKEVAEYLDYSQDRIHKLKGEAFIEGIHFHKRSGKLLFDKAKIDDWVLGIETYDLNGGFNVEEKVNDLLKDLLDA